MIYRVRKCRDGRFYVQRKRARGLAGGIWRCAAGDDGHAEYHTAHHELLGILSIVKP